MIFRHAEFLLSRTSRYFVFIFTLIFHQKLKVLLWTFGKRILIKALQIALNVKELFFTKSYLFNTCQVFFSGECFQLFSGSKNTVANTVLKVYPYSELSVSVFWSTFSCIWTQYREIRSICPYSVQIRENGDQNNSKYRHFSSSVKTKRKTGN